MRLADKLTELANAIRSITKKEEKLDLDDMKDSIVEVYDVGYGVGYTDGYNEGYDVGYLGSYNFDAMSLVNREVTEFNHETLDKIGAYVFAGCKNLTSVSLPNVTHIMEHAFDCSYGEIRYDDYNGYEIEVVKPLSKLENVYFPNLTDVGDYAFYCCFNLKELNFAKLKTIGKKAFCGCAASEVHLPLIEDIADEAFYGRYYKWEFIDGDEIYAANSYDNRILRVIDLPKAISVGARTFAYNFGLTSVSLPKVSTIGDSAFYMCEGITNITLPLATTIGSNAFANCLNLEEVTLPEAEKVGYNAFSWCEKLTRLSIPKAKEIGGSAFYYCSSLTSLNIPEAINIGSYAFYDCSKLKELKCPKLLEIGSYSFRDSGIEKLDFTNLTTIRDYGFYNSRYLNTLILRGETMVKLSGSSAFTSTKIKSGSGYIYVPRSLLSSYQSATNWSTLSSRFRVLEDYTVDGTITGDLKQV